MRGPTEVRRLARPVYALSPDGALATSLCFKRLHAGEPGECPQPPPHPPRARAMWGRPAWVAPRTLRMRIVQRQGRLRAASGSSRARCGVL